MKDLTPYLTDGKNPFVNNVQTAMTKIEVDGHQIPLTINETEYENSYVCSPYGQYIAYGIEELMQVAPKWMRRPVTAVLNQAGRQLQRREINKVVMVNNFLFSTNLYPEITKDKIETLTKQLQERYPGYAIVFKSVNQTTTPGFFEVPRIKMIPSRPIFLLDPREKKTMKARMLKSDKKILEKTEYERVSVTTEEAKRLSDLYLMLNIEKYAKQNPQFNPNFVELAIEHKLLTFIAFKRAGTIDAVAGYYSKGGVMTSPFFGYDTTKPQELGLYRLISTAMILEAEKKGELLHMSSGAGSYKRLRRARKEMEYLAVIVDHLPKKRQKPWLAIEWVMKKIGMPLLNRLEF